MKRFTIRNSDGSVSQPTELKWAEALERLADYEDAEEQGRLVMLPCKVGDTVYVTIPSISGNDAWIAKGKVSRFGYLGESLTCNVNYQHFGLCVMCGWFGKDVFLTREEAEKALKENHNGTV